MPSIGSPTVDLTHALVFGEDAEDVEDELHDMASWMDGEGEGVDGKRQSMYVSLFEDMMREVLHYESHLFLYEELTCIQRYKALSSSAKYLLVRICLRKDKWHRLSSLKYESELGPKILAALDELCGSKKRRAKRAVIQIKVEEPEVIDLTLDKEVEQGPVAGPSTLPQVFPDPPLPGPPNYDYFAEDAEEATLRELLECLSVAELKSLARTMKVKSNSNRGNIIETLLDTPTTQTTLPFPVISSNKAKRKSMGSIQTKLAFMGTRKTQTQRDRLRDLVLQTIVQCIRVNEEVVKLFRRFNLVYFRHTQYTPTLITPSILVKAKKRSYPAYEYKRTSSIWPSRQALLEYEEALEISADMEEALKGSFNSARGRSRSVASRTPAARPRGETTSPSKSSRSAKLDENEERRVEVSAEKPRITGAKAAKEILLKVYPKWEALLDAKAEEERSAGLQRFDCGHVLTRVICKGASALGILGEFRGELEILERLIGQKRWRRGRCGRWYERRALILHTHMGKDAVVLQKAMYATIEGLKDDDTHMVWRVALERRLTRLEQKLSLPPEQMHRCAARLQKAEEVYVQGTRVDKSIVLDANLKIVDKPSLSAQVNAKSFVKAEKSTGKSIWKGRNEEEVNVEMLALQHYEDRGYKGFHCEGRIATTLFGLLFWDVIFAPIPGAFETQFQSAPLDIADPDTFYTSRQTLVDARLQEILEGGGVEILKRVYDAYCEDKPMCVGVRWDMFERQDLLEITQCIGGEGLQAICRLFCEDYVTRCSGVPDLIIWNAKEGDCKFVEVKSPNDTLSENQKVWIDVLLRAGVPVHLCHVKDEIMPESVKRGKEKKPTVVTPKKRKRRMGAPMVGSDGEEDQLIESEDEGYTPLHSSRKRQRKGSSMAADADVLPSLPAEELVMQLPIASSSISMSSTRASSSSSSTLSGTPGPVLPPKTSLRRSLSRAEVVITSPASPTKRPRLMPTSSP